MPHDYSLAYLTVANLSAREEIDAATQLGYSDVGLRFLPAAPGGATHGLIESPQLAKETAARLKDTGIGVFDIEIIRIDDAFDPKRFERFLEVGKQLGAQAVLVAGDDRDPQRLAQSFASLCEVMKPYGMTADIEFMPWTAVPNLSSARSLIESAGAPSNAGILIDALHFSRSASTLEEVAALPREWLHYAQLCDAPAAIAATDAELIYTARRARLLPGDGGIDLKALLNVLPADLPLSIEIPNDERVAELGPIEWARQALAKARQIVAAS